MLRSKRYINRTSTLCVVFSIFRPIVATECAAAAPDVTEASIIAEVCNQTSNTSYSTCANQMTEDMQQSATNTCDRYFGLFTDCLVANDDNHTVCADSLFGYHDCHNYTMQAYAYCGCYYSVPESLVECANEQLQPQPQEIQTLPQTSTPVTAIPTSSDLPASAASANKEPTPNVPTVSGGTVSSFASQSAITFSDPRISYNPRLRNTSVQDVIPSSDPKIAWTPDTALIMTSEPITIVVTYTTTFTAAAYTTNATLTPAPTIISTVYTCANYGAGGQDAAVPSNAVSAASASAPTILPPIAPAPAVGLEPSASNPAIVVSAPGTEAGKETEATKIATEHTSGSSEPSPPSTSVPAQAQIASASMIEGTTEIPISSPEPSSPSTSGPAQAQNPAASTADRSTETPSGSATLSPSQALSTGLVASSQVMAGRNASVVCASCRSRRRSKIF